MLKNADIARRTVFAERMYSKEKGDRLRKQMTILRTNEQKASLNHLAENESYKDKIKSLHHYVFTILEKEGSQIIVTEGNEVAPTQMYTSTMVKMERSHVSIVSEMDKSHAVQVVKINKSHDDVLLSQSMAQACNFTETIRQRAINWGNNSKRKERLLLVHHDT